MKLMQRIQKMKRSIKTPRRGPASKNVQSSANPRSNGAAQISESMTRNRSVLKGRAKRGM